MNSSLGDPANDITMNRAGELLTVSILAVQAGSTGFSLPFLDLLDHKTYLQSVELIKGLVSFDDNITAVPA